MWPPKEPDPRKQVVVHNAAYKLLSRNPAKTNEVPETTKRAHRLTLLWQSEFPLLKGWTCFKHEYSVAGLREKFDLVDVEDRVVYELKTSGNNASHEFYKNVFKVIVHNTNAPDDRFDHLIFLVPTKGATALNRGLGWEVQRMSERLGVDIRVWNVSLPADVNGACPGLG